MKRMRFVIGFIAVVIVGILAAWLLGWIGGDRALAEVEQLRTKLSDPTLNDADRNTLREHLRTKMTSLSPEARDAVRETGRQQFEKRMHDRLAKILAMSKADQTKALDAEIDRMLKMQADRQAAEKAADASQKSGVNQKGQNRQANRGGFRTDADRINRIKNRLDRSTPEVRAQRQQFMQLLNQRLHERGLPPITRRWG